MRVQRYDKNDLAVNQGLHAGILQQCSERILQSGLRWGRQDLSVDVQKFFVICDSIAALTFDQVKGLRQSDFFLWKKYRIILRIRRE